jgi:excisionase family DNA binding protein
MDQPSPRTTFARFLTITDTAEVLNVSVSQAYTLVRSGELPAIRIGGRGQWRIERDVLEHYIEAKYEESRRASLWNQSDYSNIAEFAFAEDQSRTYKS